MLVMPLIGVPGTLRDRMPGVVLKRLTDRDGQRLRPRYIYPYKESVDAM
jgi:hypothetical protein